MAASLTALSASVTRILSLTGFPKELKTKDIQTAFGEWENASGGFKIKWVDDTSLYVVFQDPTVAKRAYLKTIAYPPSVFSTASSSTSTGVTTIIRPYDGPDAQAVIHAVNARHNTNNASRSARSTSMSISSGGVPLSFGNHPNGVNGHGHAARPSLSIPRAVSNGHDSGLTPIISAGGLGQHREASPTLPNLPAQPTLNALIENSLANARAGTTGATPADLALGADPAVLAAGLGPRIGDPGKRMLGHALGVRHPGLPQRNGDVSGLQKAMNGLAVAEAV